MKKRLTLFLTVLFVGYVTYKSIHNYDKRADGFTLEKIHSSDPNDPRWDVTVSNEQIQEANRILNQPFRYLGRGFQCYAFISEDQQYVLKFFRYQRMRLSSFAALLPNIGPVRSFREKKAIDFEKRKNYLFQGAKVGFESAKEETALLFIHLNKTKNQHGQLTIYDKTGTRHVVELDNIEFMLQRKAVHIKPTIDQLVKDGKVDDAKRRIGQIFEHFVRCAKKGIHDADKALICKNNLGFLEDRAIYIDSGTLSIKEDMNTKDRFVHDLKRLYLLEKWLRKTHPELVATYLECKQKAINEF